MPIDSRKSEDHLHTDVILREISEYDIFMYYCPSFTDTGKKFCSELRVDNSPTASIINWHGNLLYKDFGCTGHVFNCFGYVQYKYNCTFIEALKIIDCDFNLKLSPVINNPHFTMGVLGKKTNVKIKPATPSIIKKRKRAWIQDDANFWKKYFITKEILTTFAVEPITHYWVNSNRFSCKSITYSYRFGKRYKIYAPYETEYKWTSNVKSTDIQGLKQLPITGDTLFLTSSLKDIMCLYAAGYNSIAFQSEMQLPDENLIQDLQNRFNKIIVFYDNDYDNVNNPGQTMARKICEKFNLDNVCIPNMYGCKDPSDLVKKIGSLNILKHIINEQTRSN